MKILHVGKFYPPHRGGIETVVETLCRGTKDAVDLEVLVSSDDAKEVVDVLDGVRVRRLPTWFNLSSAPINPGLVSAIRASRADIVHLHIPHPVAVLAWLASGHRAPMVVGYHGDIMRQKILWPAFRPFLRAALRRASAIVASSPDYIDASPTLNEFRERCVVIPYGVRIEELERPDPGEVARIRAQAGPRVVLAVGRLVGYKGFEFLVRAMASVDAKLLLVGNGPLRGSLGALARSIGVEGKVIFVEKADDLAPYYHAADVFVLPSINRAESFGIVQAEAMACRKPVVNTTIESGLKFVSVHGQSGFSVPPGDASALAAAINGILNDDELRARFGKAARERAVRDFTSEVMASRTLALYQRVAAGAKTGINHVQ